MYHIPVGRHWDPNGIPIAPVHAACQRAMPRKKVTTTSASESLSLKAYEAVLDLALSGTLRPGEVVQERRLATSLSLSRTPLRVALNRLEGEGLLVRLSDRALAVRNVGKGEFLETLAVRRLLEVEAARLAAGRVPSETLRSLIAQVQSELRHGTDPQEETQLDDLIHRTIADFTGNNMLAATIINLRRHRHLFDARRMFNRQKESAGEHLQILNALLSSDGAQAAAAMERHLDAVRASLLAGI